MSDFDLNRFLAYIELLKEHNRTSNKKEKEIIKDKMEAIKNGLMPISLKEDK